MSYHNRNEAEFKFVEGMGTVVTVSKRSTPIGAEPVDSARISGIAVNQNGKVELTIEFDHPGEIFGISRMTMLLEPAVDDVRDLFRRSGLER